MSGDPVVEMINAILNGEDNFILLLQRPQLERIRDEIVALRERVERQRLVLSQGHAEVRDAALEEAARIAEHGGGSVGASIAKSIRARVTPGTSSTGRPPSAS